MNFKENFRKFENLKEGWNLKSKKGMKIFKNSKDFLVFQTQIFANRDLFFVGKL